MVVKDHKRAHDVVLENVRTMLAGKYGAHRVISGADPSSTRELCGHRPDIVLLGNDGQTEAIFEIETAHSVGSGASHRRWIAFASLDIPLYLVVPTETRAQTNLVIRSYGLESAVGNLLLY